MQSRQHNHVCTATRNGAKNLVCATGPNAVGEEAVGNLIAVEVAKGVDEAFGQNV